MTNVMFLFIESTNLYKKIFFVTFLKGQFLTIESPLKMVKNPFYFILKAPFFLEVFTFLSRFCGYIEKEPDKKTIVNFKIYDVTDWTKSNYNTHIIQYLKTKRQSSNEIWSVNKI